MKPKGYFVDIGMGAGLNEFGHVLLLSSQLAQELNKPIDDSGFGFGQRDMSFFFTSEAAAEKFANRAGVWLKEHAFEVLTESPEAGLQSRQAHVSHGKDILG